MKLRNPFQSATNRLISKEVEYQLYEKAAIGIENNSIDKVLEKTTVDTIDLALVQLDRYSDYGSSEEDNHHVIIMQGKKKPVMIKHWFLK